MSGRVLICRHGETALNVKGDERIRGFKNVPLNENGKQQAIQLALKLKDFPISVIYHSSLGRAQETAKAIANVTNAPLIEDPHLVPWCCGKSIEGQPVKDVLPIIKWFAAHPNEVPPHGGEAFKTFTDRYLTLLRDKLHTAKTLKTDQVLVAHSRNLQLTRAWDAAGRPADMSYDTSVMNDYRRELPPSAYMIVSEDGLQEIP